MPTDSIFEREREKVIISTYHVCVVFVFRGDAYVVDHTRGF